MVTADEWPEFCMECTIAKAATPATNLFLNTGTMEEFKAFADADKDRQGLPPQRGGRQGLLPQHGDHEVLNLINTNQYNISDDVSTHASADNDRQGLLQQRGGHLNGSHDVLPSPTTTAGNDGRVRGSLPIEADVPKPEEEHGRNDGPLRVAEVLHTTPPDVRRQGARGLRR